MLDLLRPLLIFIVLAEGISDWRKRLWKVLKIWAPYLVVFIGAAIWRFFFFPYTQENYKLSFLDQLKAVPLQAIGGLIVKALGQIWTAFGAAWIQVFHLPSQNNAAAAGDLLHWVLLLVLVLLFLLVVLLNQKRSGEIRRSWGWQALLIGAAALLLAGWPFWLTDVPFSLNFANDRFTLPFMLGVSLVLAGIFDLVPLKAPIKSVVLAVVVTLAVSWQVENASSYVQDWKFQRGFFLQLTWRVPGLVPGTTILANELPVHPTDNSLTAPLNWIYGPGDAGGSLPYLLNWPTIRLGTETLPALAAGQPIRKDYLVSVFTGSTDRAIAVYFQPPECLRLLDWYDGNNPGLPELSRSMAPLSNPALVTSQTSYGPAQLIPGIFSSAQPVTWCEYYEKADLARQRSDWSAVAQIASQAGDLVQKANTPVELFPFIESFAHLGNWDKVAELSKAAVSDSNGKYKDLVCTFLAKVQNAMPSTPSKATGLTSLNQLTGCSLGSAH
jgi:hypothetical protein